MATYLTTTEDLTTVANAIRTKGGTSAQLSFPNGMASAIADIQTGGGGTMPEAYYEWLYNSLATETHTRLESEKASQLANRTAVLNTPVTLYTPNAYFTKYIILYRSGSGYRIIWHMLQNAESMYSTDDSFVAKDFTDPINSIATYTDLKNGWGVRLGQSPIIYKPSSGFVMTTSNNIYLTTSPQNKMFNAYYSSYLSTEEDAVLAIQSPTTTYTRTSSTFGKTAYAEGEISNGNLLAGMWDQNNRHFYVYTSPLRKISDNETIVTIS